VAASLDHLATLLSDFGRFGEADSLYAQALAINRELLGEPHAMIAFNLNNLAITRYRAGDLAGADTLYRASIAQYQAVFGAEHANPAVVAMNLAGVLRERGRLDEAERRYRDALAVLELRPEMSGRVGQALAGLGQTLMARGDDAGAEPLLRRAVELTEAQFGAADWRTAEARLALGLCLRALGRREEGAALVRAGRDALLPFRDRQPRLVQRADAAVLALAGAAGRN
jgi:tetratricopeptide (TPR) repeat protein